MFASTSSLFLCFLCSVLCKKHHKQPPFPFEEAIHDIDDNREGRAEGARESYGKEQQFLPLTSHTLYTKMASAPSPLSGAKPSPTAADGKPSPPTRRGWRALVPGARAR